MASNESYEFECTKKCRSFVHGGVITAACTKRSVPDQVLLRFLAKLCKNFAEVADKEGRSALHLVASSSSRTGLVEFLLKNGANANLKDLESGQTPLHRSIFYGCLKSAVVLMQSNASVDIQDVESLSPLHYCLAPKRKQKRHDTETFAFGSNSHYNLPLGLEGHGTASSAVPKCVDYFKRNSIFIKSVAMSSFHTLFLATNNDLYSVGHGVGGRLGHGSESTVVQPQKLNLRFKRTDEKIVSFSASKNHSLILTNLGNVYACGSNYHGQLGVADHNCTKLLEFKNINCNEFQNQNLLRVIALENHSIAFSDREIFAWGQNSGQLGLRTTSDVVRIPQSVPLNGQKIILLDACNTGLAFYSGNNKYLNVFINHKMKFFKTPSLEGITQLTIGDADKVVKVLVMTESYQIYIWDDANQKYTKCFFAMFRQLDVEKMFWSGSRIVFLTGEDIYISTAMNAVAYNESEDVSEYQEIYSTKKDICQTNRIKINLKRVCYGSNVRDVWSDYEGLNFIFIREDPFIHLKVPTIHDQNITLDVVYEEMNECDGIHDVLFHVGRATFPAHKYVLLSRAPEVFAKWIESAEDGKNVFIDVDGLSPVVFELILKIIYTNHFLTEEDVKRLKAFYNLSDAVQALTRFTKLMKSLNLGQFLDKNKKNLPKFQLDRNSYPELHDVTIKCANDWEVKAHKCVLVSRLQYFNVMFNSSWIESSKVNFSTVPVEYVEILLDFLYENSASRLLSKKYSEAFVTNMIVLTDQLFVDRLKDIFQLHILKRFTMKRCPELLELAYTYHCEILKKSILDFICANLKDVLENRYLENVHLDYLTDLDERYREMFPEIKYRQVVPSSQIDEEFIESFAKNFTVDMNAAVATAPTPTTASAKPSPREPKSTTKTKLDYEKEGKLILLQQGEGLVRQEEPSPGKAVKSLALEESVQVLADIQLKNSKVIWQQVVDKRPERKSVVISALNANEVLRNEEKLTENFSNLKLVLRGGSGGGGVSSTNAVEKSPMREDEEIMVEHSPSQINTRISFGDFFSPPPSAGGRDRMSQKQRKRQSSRISESDIDTNNSLSSPHINRETTTPTAAVPFESVWNIPKDNGQHNTADLGALKKNPAKDDKAKGTQVRAINFDAILMDEKEERQYFTKLKSKALTLTQLEESAMSELHAFYNVDQVFDETIEIERKVRQQVSQNFSQWARPATTTTAFQQQQPSGSSAGASSGLILL